MKKLEKNLIATTSSIFRNRVELICGKEKKEIRFFSASNILVMNVERRKKLEMKVKNDKF